jgi:hypothetical protein
MSQQGITYTQVESSDLTSIANELDAWAASVKTYLDGVEAAETEEDMEALLVPAVIPIGAVIIWLAKGASVYLAVKIITTLIDVGVDMLRRKLSPGKQSDVVGVLRRALLDAEGGSIYSGIIEAILSLETLVDLPGLAVWLRSGYTSMQD